MTNPGGHSFSKVVQVPQDAAADTAQRLRDYLKAAQSRRLSFHWKEAAHSKRLL